MRLPPSSKARRVRNQPMQKGKSLRLGLIGFGTVGKSVQAGIARGEAGNTELVAALVRREPADQSSDFLITTDLHAFFSSELDLVLEVAGQEAVEQHGEMVLNHGIDFMLISVGALADDDLHQRLRAAAEQHGARLLIPSGAIAGLDA